MKKICSLGVTLFLVFTLLAGTGALAAAEEEDLLCVPGEASATGDLALSEAPPSLEGSGGGRLLYASALPSSYDTRANGSVPSPRTQGDNYGTCWAISAVSCAEIYGYNHGLLSTGTTLSPWHLAYFSSHSSTDPLGNCSGDYNTSAQYLTAGNPYRAVLSLASWHGPASESATNSAYSNLSASVALSDSCAYSTSLQLKNAYLLSAATETDRAVLKQYIMQCGGATMCFYSTAGRYTYGEDYTCYYQNAATTTSHEVTVIGWDDSFSADNFDPLTEGDTRTEAERVKPDRDGAWLCQNSWGSDWGDGGYFWLSYYDSSVVAGTCVVYEYSAGDTHDNNYQYDAAVIPGKRSFTNTDCVYYGNVFTASGTEELSAVGAYSTGLNVPYTVYVYKDLTDASDPTGGTLVSTTSGTFPYLGYYTVEVEPVLLWEGESFSVVIRVGADADGKVLVPTCYTNSSWLSVNEVEPGQSFTSANGATWRDCAVAAENLTACNVRVKALTDNVTRYVTVKLDAAGGSVSAESVSALFGAAIGALPTPVRENYRFLGWFTQASGGESVGEDYFIAAADTVTLYAHWEEEEPAAGRFEDVSADDWFAEAVQYGYEHGLLYGVSDTLFAPQSEATRGQVAVVLYRLAGSPAVSGEAPFDDVPAGEYYAAAVTWAAENGIAYGWDDNGDEVCSFFPNAAVTRQDFLCLLYRYAAYAGREISAATALDGFEDAASVSEYALAAEKWSVATGLQLGDNNNLKPLYSITRAELAMFLMRFAKAAS